MDFLTLADYAGTCAFAISGTLSASEKRLDLFGAAFIGFVTAIGGGTTRDVLLGNTPVTWIQGNTYFILILSAILFTFVFHRYIIKLKNTLFLFDTLGIGAFTIIGLEKGLEFGLTEPVAIIMGLSSAVVGGVIRDTLCNDVPIIFHKEIYATACIAGSIVYLILAKLNVNLIVTESITISTIIIVRLLAIKFNLSLPTVTTAQKD
ncbi:trimeric intracellular cation channel family protein [Saccharicrinis aurantiacus]|uniref:trimeric intracellular cation channel family protein n=1 Tax=Saccharicrinis aurantiacus TaxID=1849719 RepID=UPI000838692E|nr:trimeric intracellular cation channel family protein [Saccharicrinis aurantiacus]